MSESSSLQLAKACAQAACDTKASDIAIYDLRGCSSLTDFAVICTASSVPHLRAVLREVDDKVGERLGVYPVHAERTPVALWAVLDYIDVMVHIMSEEIREFYNMEDLWKDGCPVAWTPDETAPSAS